MAQSGAFNEPVSETQLVALLEKISDTKQDTKIKVNFWPSMFLVFN